MRDVVKALDACIAHVDHLIEGYRLLPGDLTFGEVAAVTSALAVVRKLIETEKSHDTPNGAGTVRDGRDDLAVRHHEIVIEDYDPNNPKILP